MGVLIAKLKMQHFRINNQHEIIPIPNAVYARTLGLVVSSSTSLLSSCNFFRRVSMRIKRWSEEQPFRYKYFQSSNVLGIPVLESIFYTRRPKSLRKDLVLSYCALIIFFKSGNTSPLCWRWKDSKHIALLAFRTCGFN